MLIIIFIIVILVIFNKKKYHEINVFKVAKTWDERKKGLMFRKKKLPDNSCMLFLYKNPQNVSFWMKNTFIPLDIILLDKNKKVVHLCNNMIPFDEKNNCSYDNIKYGLEMNSNSIYNKNIKINDYIKFIN